MPMKGYDLFYTEPDAVESMLCLVCGSTCEVERSLFGPTGFVEGLAQLGHWHDKFSCPHSEQRWHSQALELVMQIDETPSKRLAELMRQDWVDILKAHNCNQPEGVEWYD